MKFKKLYEGAANEVLEGDGFYISFNDFNADNEILSSIESLGIIFGLERRSGTSNPETALVNKKGEEIEWYILNGDFREEYEKLAPLGYEACESFYQSKKEKYNSTWST